MWVRMRSVPALSRTFPHPVETLFSHGVLPHHASMKTGMSEASSRIAMMRLKVRTILREDNNGRSALPNIAHVRQEKVPRIRPMATWIAIFQGKAAIAAYAVMVEITITQPLALIHWNI